MKIIKPLLYLKFFLLLLSIVNTVSAEEKKNLKLVLDTIDKVREDENILSTNITFHKVGDDEVKVNGVINQTIDLDDNHKIFVDVFHSTQKDGEYKKVFRISKMGVCRIMANYYKKYLYDSLKDYANVPDPDKCPLTKESYTVTDYPLDSSKFQKYLRPGFYKLLAYLMYQKEELLRYTVESHTENA